MQHYRETANYLERTSEWVERVGLESIRAVVVDDIQERKALMERIEFALGHVEEPWQKAIRNEQGENKLFHGIEVTARP